MPQLDEETVQIILKDLDSSKISANVTAIRAIKQQETLLPEIQEKLLDIYQNSASTYVREEAQETLLQFDVRLPQSLFAVDHSLSDRELLLRTITILEKQDEQLLELKNKIGCIYQFVIALVILIVFTTILSFL